MEDYKDILNREYPEIKNFCRNSYYSGILQNLFAGSEGEVVLFMQLQYHSNILKNYNPKISEILTEISLTDLKHQQLLSNAIEMTYGNPIYATTQGKWVGGRQIDYIKDIKQILHANLEAKEKAIIDYKLAISKVENQQIKMLLSAILSDEETHRLILKKLIKSIETN